MTPTITVIVAIFNAAKTLQHCIDSVAGQTYAPRELIVIDGGSTDGTREILERSAAPRSCGAIAPYAFESLRMLGGKPRYWTRQ